VRYEIRPLGPWIEPVTQGRSGSGRFRATWSDTLDLLQYESGLLGATLIVVQVDVTDAELRRDGMLRTNAKVGFPGVRVSFDSKHGPLTYATDAYDQRYYGDPPGWQANVRAIALSLQALRAVDRYGVSRRGEQYRGWTPIAATVAELTVDQAAELLAEATGRRWTAQQILTDPDALKAAYKAAVAPHHPDRGGDPAEFDRITKARDLIKAGIR
jgi:hypothetical protein